MIMTGGKKKNNHQTTGNESSMQNRTDCAGSSEAWNSSSGLENGQHLCVHQCSVFYTLVYGATDAVYATSVRLEVGMRDTKEDVNGTKEEKKGY